MNVQCLRRWNKGFALSFQGLISNQLINTRLFVPLQKNIQFIKLILNTYIVETANSSLSYSSILIAFNVQAIKTWAKGERLKFNENVKDKLCNHCIQNFIYDYLLKQYVLPSNKKKQWIIVLLSLPMFRFDCYCRFSWLFESTTNWLCKIKQLI